MLRFLLRAVPASRISTPLQEMIPYEAPQPPFGLVSPRAALVFAILFSSCLVFVRADLPSLPERPIPVEMPPSFDGRPIDLQYAGSGQSWPGLSPDCKTLATSVAGNHPQSGQIKLWNISERKPVASYPESGLAGAIAYSPDGRRLAYAMADSTVKIRDCARGRSCRCPARASHQRCHDPLHGRHAHHGGRRAVAALGHGNVPRIARRQVPASRMPRCFPTASDC